MKPQTSPAGVALGVIAAAVSLGLAASPALAEAAPPPKIDAADTAWMISATGLVLMMTIPGLALFYCGMVRKKNVLATMAQSLACMLVAPLVCGRHSLSRRRWSLARNIQARHARHHHGVSEPTGATSRNAVHDVSDDVAIITVALISGAVADRMRFSAFLWFAGAWRWSMFRSRIGSGAGILAKAGLLDFAGGTVVHLNRHRRPGAPMWSASATRHRQFRAHNLALAVIGTGLLWVGGSASTAARRSDQFARLRHRRDPSCRLGRRAPTGWCWVEPAASRRCSA
jgi:Amt family ammonium transporter